jgi:hypothetical protein
MLAPSSIAEAPAHAATLVRMLGARPATVIATAASLLGEEADALLEAHTDWMSWLDAPTGDPPVGFASQTTDDRARVATLRGLVPEGFCPVLARFDPSPSAALLAVLHACGLREAHQFEIAIVLARLPVAVAEAQEHAPSQLSEYPMTVPPFVYHEGDP